MSHFIRFNGETIYPTPMIDGQVGLNTDHITAQDFKATDDRFTWLVAHDDMR